MKQAEHRKRKLELIKALQERQVRRIVGKDDLNIKLFDHRWSLLHYAAWLDDKQAAIDLLDLGADMDEKDAHGDTAAELAERLNRFETADAIKNYPALRSRRKSDEHYKS